MYVKKLSLGLLRTNCYILSKSNECLIFDPGAEPEKVINYLTENNLTPKAILLTHAHFDHIGAVEKLRNDYSIDVYLHDAEKEWMMNSALNGSFPFLSKKDAIQVNKADKLITAGIWQISSFNFEVVHTPGHSPGSITFIFHDEKFIISGDVLFQGGIGRTDGPGGDFDQLITSILGKLYTLEDEFTVYSGHGQNTTIGHEKKSNPFTLQYTS